MDGTPRPVRILGPAKSPGTAVPGDLRRGPGSSLTLRPRVLQVGSIGKPPVTATANAGPASAAEGSSSRLLVFALVCAIFQFYIIPLGGFYLSLGLVSSYLLMLRVNVRELITLRVSQVFILLMLTEAASLVWSPTPLLGVREIIYDVPFLLVYLATRQIAAKNEEAIYAALKIFCVVGASHSLLMIAMVLSPQIKEVFFASPLGAIFINGNSLTGIASGLTQSTAFGADKSPGFFVNANVAGVWEATGLWVTLFLFQARRSLIMIPILLLHAVAILAAGSKASAALLFMIPCVTAIALFIFPPYGKQRHLLLALCGGVTVFLIPYIVFKHFSQLHFVQDSAHTFMSRSVMWNHAWEQFKIHPLLGQGFGGWTQSFAPVGYAYGYLGVRPDFPPHNSLIIVWSQSGGIALLLTFVLLGLLFRDALKPRLVPGGVTLSRCTFGAFLFIVVQAMGENYGVLGDVHIKIPLAVMLGWASTYDQRRPKR